MPVNLQSADAAECGDGELRMVMKRLTKRDAVTKLKVIDFDCRLVLERVDAENTLWVSSGFFLWDQLKGFYICSNIL